MKVLMINPPSEFLKDDKANPPLGILYIAAYLEQSGVDVDVIDLASLSENQWKIPHADIYGISSVTPQFPYAQKIANVIRIHHPEALIIIGGHHPSALPEQSLRDSNFDIVVVGEGELTMLEIAKGIELKNITGIYYKDGMNILKNPPRKPIKNLDNIPFPKRSKVDIHSYHAGVSNDPATTIITSRGCPFNCSFCSKAVFGRKVRLRSVDNILAEIQSLIEQYGFKSFLFVDDTFTSNRGRVYELCKELKKMNLSWRCWTRTDRTDVETFKMMRDAGCKEVSFGIESGSQKILNIINKSNTVEQNKKAILDAKTAGIITKVFLMVGLPYETNDDINLTKKFIKETMPDQWMLSTFIPLPGCDIWNNPSKYNVDIISKDFSNYHFFGKKLRKYVTSDEKQTQKFRNDLSDFLEKLIPQDFFEN